MRSTTHRRTQYHDDDDDLADPRPWETRVPLSKYGSGGSDKTELPVSAMDAKEREDTEGEKEVLFDDAQGKWNKGHGAGPGVGGRRGLRPRQRVDGWVSDMLLWLSFKC